MIHRGNKIQKIKNIGELVHLYSGVVPRLNAAKRIVSQVRRARFVEENLLSCQFFTPTVSYT